jgi:hypothetical protein
MVTRDDAPVAAFGVVHSVIARPRKKKQLLPGC